MPNTSEAARRKASRPWWRAAAGAWGPPGNERLTTSTGLALLVLLAVETLTTLSLRSYLPVHIFLGLLLIPPVALKLASTGWQFLRYYTRNEAYRHEGPPRLLLRVLAPLLVASTLTLFGSGVALIVVGHGGGLLLSVHAVSFGIWGVVMIVHVLAYVARTLRLGPVDWLPHAERVVAGVRSRRAALAGALFAGAILALATYPAQQGWLSHRHERRHTSTPPGGHGSTAPWWTRRRVTVSEIWRAEQHDRLFSEDVEGVSAASNTKSSTFERPSRLRGPNSMKSPAAT